MEYQIQLLCTYMQEIMNSKKELEWRNQQGIFRHQRIESGLSGGIFCSQKRKNRTENSDLRASRYVSIYTIIVI